MNENEVVEFITRILILLFLLVVLWYFSCCIRLLGAEKKLLLPQVSILVSLHVMPR